MFKNFLSDNVVCRVKKEFYLRDTLIPVGSLGRILDITENGETILVDFGSPKWVVCRFSVYEKELIEFVTMEELIKKDRKKYQFRYLKHKIYKIFRIKRKKSYYHY